MEDIILWYPPFFYRFFLTKVIGGGIIFSGIGFQPLHYFKGPGYVHYWWANALDDIDAEYTTSLVNMWSAAKGEIISQAGSDAIWKIMQQYDKAGMTLSDEQFAIADFIMDGVAIPGLDDDEVGQEGYAENAGVSEGLVANFTAFKQALNDGSQYQLKLQEMAESFKQDSVLYSEVRDYVKMNFKSAKGIESTSVQNILSQLMSKKDGTLFAMPQNGSLARLSRFTQSWLVMLYALGEGKINTRTARGVRAYIKNISVKKFGTIARELAAVANQYGQLQAQKKIMQPIQDMNRQIALSVGVNGKFTQSADFQSANASLQQQISAAKNGINFSANNIIATTGEDNVQVSVGGVRVLSSINKTNTDDTVNELHIQNAESMYELMTNKLRMSSFAVEKVIQLATAQSGGGVSETVLTGYWEKFKQYMTYSLIVSSLVEGQQGVANTLIKVNDDIVPTLSFLNFLIRGINPQGISDYSTIVRGWQSRQYFSNLAADSWVGDMSAHSEDAEIRSAFVQTQAMAQLQNIKLDVRLNAVNLTALRKYAI